MNRPNILMTFACTTCGHVHSSHAGFAVHDIDKPVCADIGQQEDIDCFNRVNKILLLYPAELEAITQPVKERHSEIKGWVELCKQPPPRAGLAKAEAALVVAELALKALGRNEVDNA